MKVISILIVDSHRLFRETWSLFINAHASYQVVGTCATAEEGLSLAQQSRPDVIMMDVHLSGIGALEATKRYKQELQRCKIIGVSLHNQPTYAKRMLQSGASGYVTKNTSSEEMFQAIEAVHRGEKYICENVKTILAEQLTLDSSVDKIHLLSMREIEVIAYIQNGYSSQSIAHCLGVSKKTIEVHRYHILRKMNLKSRTELVSHINKSELNAVLTKFAFFPSEGPDRSISACVQNSKQ